MGNGAKVLVTPEHNPKFNHSEVMGSQKEMLLGVPVISQSDTFCLVELKRSIVADLHHFPSL